MNKVDHGTNDHGLLARVLGRLQDAGFSPLVFGGWAQELLQLVPPRPHVDVDLLLLADSLLLSINLCLQQRAMAGARSKLNGSPTSVRLSPKA
jgi:hypothetical protein